MMKKEFILLVLIFILACTLRIYSLPSVPHAFHRDEVINTYIGRYILLNGVDLYGNKLPIFYFNKYGDYPPILPMYLSGIATFIFGVNEMSSRIIPAFVGGLIVFPIFFISQFIYKNYKLSLLSALFISIFPWHIVLSRSSSEGILAVTAFTTGLAFLFKGIKNKNFFLVTSSLFLFLLTYFLYPSFRLFIPLSLFPLPFIFRVNKYRNILILFIVISLLLTALIAQTKWGRARFDQTSLFGYSNPVPERLKILSNDEGQNNIMFARIFHNKIVGYTHEFINQYLSYFSTDFLFIRGGSPPEYVVPDSGLLYITYFILLIGLALPFAVSIENRLYYYTLYLLAVAPIPSALTTDFVPHVHRSLIMTVPIVLIMPYGFLKIFSVFGRNKKRYFSIATYLLLFFLFIETTYSMHQYFRHTASFKSVFRNDGATELAVTISDMKKKYSKVLMPVYGNLPIYYLFYTNDFNPLYVGKFHGDLEIDYISNIEFKRDSCPSILMEKETIPQNTLIVDDANCKILSRYKEVRPPIFRKDGTRAYRFLVVEK